MGNTRGHQTLPSFLSSPADNVEEVYESLESIGITGVARCVCGEAITVRKYIPIGSYITYSMARRTTESICTYVPFILCFLSGNEWTIQRRS